MKKNSAKTLWYILFAVIAVALCYLFVVVYFFYISPYSISSKTTVWPFLSDMAVGELCLDATVEIDFTVVEEDNFNEKVEHKIVGVNVRKDGFVVAPYSDLRNADPDSPIRIYANSGEIFEGVVLYGDMNYNLAILKCESLNENGLVALPYVEIAGVSNKVYFDSRVIMVGSPVDSGEIVINDVTDHNLVCGIETEIDGNFAVDYVLEYCFTTRVGVNDTLETAAVFNDDGQLMGFVDDVYQGEKVVMAAEGAENFLSDVVSSYQNGQTYQNNLVSAFVGFDYLDVLCFMDESSLNSDETLFYFNEQWQSYTNDIYYFANNSDSGFYLFEDFDYNGNFIAAGNVVTALSFNSRSHSIDSRVDMIDLVYELKAGDSVTVYFQSVEDLGDLNQKITFTV